MERLQWASTKINTEFVMCLAEDDFYLKSGIEKSIKKLKENVDAVACMGTSIGLDKFLMNISRDQLKNTELKISKYIF